MAELVIGGSGVEDVGVDGRRVRRRRLDIDISQTELGRRAGVVASYISQIEAGKKTRVALPTLGRIADALGVPVSDLVTSAKAPEPEPTPVSATPVEMVYVPVVGTVPGGAPLLVEEVSTGERIIVPAEAVRGIRRPRALLVRGDSMEPDILDGEYVVFDPDALWAVGDVVVALVGNETTVKRIQLVDGVPKLTPANHKHGIVEPGAQEVRIQGRVVWVQPKGRRL